MLKSLFVYIVTIFLISCRTDNKSEIIDRNLNDSIQKITSENDYLKLLFVVNSKPSLHNDIPPIRDAYEVSDTAFVKPITIFSGNDNKRKLVIRYTAVGCHSCTDELFKTLSKTPGISEKYDILVLANYTDYMYFLKWYKIAEVNYNVLFLSKGKIPNDLENDNTSYAFVFDNGKVSSLFIPNSLFPNHTKVYFDTLLM